MDSQTQKSLSISVCVEVSRQRATIRGKMNGLCVLKIFVVSIGVSIVTGFENSAVIPSKKKELISSVIAVPEKKIGYPEKQEVNIIIYSG